MNHRTRVYIAGPITKGDLATNIKRATDAALDLLRAGYAPLCPHLTCYMGGPTPEVLPCGTRHEDWYGVDLPWVAVSQAVLRLPGESVGADLEVAKAVEFRIPVFDTLAELLKELPPQSKDGRSEIDRAGVEHEPWFVAVMNDCNFLINRAPPRGDYDSGLKTIARIGPSRQDDEAARFLADTHNALLAEIAALKAERDELLGLDPEDMDAVLDRWDQTAPHLQRGIVAKLAALANEARDELDEARRVAAQRAGADPEVRDVLLYEVGSTEPDLLREAFARMREKSAEAARLALLAAWQAGELSDGQFCALTGLGRLAARELLLRTNAAAQARWAEYRAKNPPEGG